MKAATWSRPEPLDERLLVIDPRSGVLEHRLVRELPRSLRAGDLLVVNDAATLPASLQGWTPSNESIELRLLEAPDDTGRARAVLFGAGSWRQKRSGTRHT